MPGPIGVFDSGVGGLTVLHECLVSLPHEDFVYFGDSSPDRFPYGPKPAATIRRFAHEIATHLAAPRRQADRRRLQLGDRRRPARPAARVRGAADRRDHARGARRGAGHAQPPGRRDGDPGDRRQRPLPGCGAGARRRHRGHPGRLSRAGAADPGRRRARPRVAGGRQGVRGAAQARRRRHRHPGLHALPADPADAAADLRPRGDADHLGRGGRPRGRRHAGPARRRATTPAARATTASCAPATRTPSGRGRAVPAAAARGRRAGRPGRARVAA